ncbi:heparinase II/III domain-containing protein [Sanguibacter sp. Leaf3]|uniref:heparinase II/III domain-containing protein n=1 Tax=Sanguibacter sp. Leaf3 TaxID=1736209 RepID=UPI0006FD4F9D|nr:heparinase II/III family protein [Sanguibacter sp. Leaf3]KQT97654.1 hypothetical protein ASG53_07555 [Sanguibacter sp. Leaf3]
MTVQTSHPSTTPQVSRSRGGWWHDYVCPTHGTELGAPVDDRHPCPHGCTLVGPGYAAAWTVLEHQAWARRARLLARRAVSAEVAEGAAGWVAGPRDDRLEAEAVVRELAATYAQVGGWSEQSEPWMLRGKLFSQALTEAIWAVQVADAVTELATDPGAADRLGVETVAMVEGLLETVTAARHVLVVEQQNPQSNYTAWLDAAGGLLSSAARALTGDRADSAAGGSAGAPARDVARAVAEPAETEPAETGAGHDRLAAGPDGRPWVEATWAHTALAIGDDGWEWEGSTYYHLFVLRAYLLAHRGIAPSDVDETALRTIASMVRVLVELAAPDGSLPALHDGPYDRLGVHLEVLEVCALAGQLWASTGLETVEAQARSRAGADHDGLEDLLGGWFAGPPLPALETSRGSRLFDDVGYAVLRSPDGSWQAVLDAGPHGGSHGHLDKLGLYLYGPDGPWQPAPGVPPYASALRKGYYARTLAHPTVQVDGLDQAESSGTIVSWSVGHGPAPTPTPTPSTVGQTPTTDEETTSGRMPTTSVLARADDAYPGVRLSRQVVMEDEYLLDVVTVSCDRERDITLALRPAGRLDVTADGDGWTTRWSGPDGRGPELHGVHRSSSGAALVARPGRGPSDDPARVLTVGDWEARATQVTYVSAYSTQGAVESVELLDAAGEAAGALTVRVGLRRAGPTSPLTTRDHEVLR